MTYSKEIVREWLDQVAERAKEYLSGWMSLNVVIQTLWIIQLNFRRWFNLCVTGTSQLCGCVTQRLN